MTPANPPARAPVPDLQGAVEREALVRRLREIASMGAMIHTLPWPLIKSLSTEAAEALSALRAPVEAVGAPGEEELHDIIAAAYVEGCRDTHANYEPQADPEFGEAAQDYAHSVVFSRLGGRGGESFQARVEPWMRETFGDVIPFDKVERGDRFLEEAFELLQSGGYDPARVLALRDYVWGRPAGEPSQEVGGVMITLAAYCLAFGLNMHAAGETELARIWTKIEAIRAKQAAKPTGSALPTIAPEGGEGEGR